MNLLDKGYVADDEIERYPGDPCSGIHPVIECTQNIPCNPCQDACAKGCISIGENIYISSGNRSGQNVSDVVCA